MNYRMPENIPPLSPVGGPAPQQQSNPIFLAFLVLVGLAVLIFLVFFFLLKKKEDDYIPFSELSKEEALDMLEVNESITVEEKESILRNLSTTTVSSPGNIPEGFLSSELGEDQEGISSTTPPPVSPSESPESGGASGPSLSEQEKSDILKSLQSGSPQ